MKDHRFIELVNLYIDRQISPAEATELETELQANPRRRQVYQQYCRMHRATQLVYESFRQEAGREAPQSATQGGSLVRLEGARRRRDRWAYAVAGMAAAACVGLIVSRTFLADGSVPTTLAEVTPSSAITSPAPTRVAVEIPPAAPALEVRSPLTLQADYQSMLASFQLSEPTQGTSARAPRSLFEDESFGRPLTDEQRSQLRRSPSQTATEFTAFQFQR